MQTQPEPTDTPPDSFVRAMLRETARSFLDTRAPLEWAAEQADREVREPDRLWPLIAEMGWMGVAVPEAQGGSGLGVADQATLFEEFGRALYPGPYFSSVALAQRCLEGTHGVLDRLVVGTSVFTVAWAEVGGPGSLVQARAARCRAERGADEWRLYGTKTAVPDLEFADEVLVFARTDNGVGLFVVGASAEGVRKESATSLDPSRRESTLVLDRALAVQVLAPDPMAQALPFICGWALLAATFEALGVAERVLQDAAEYAKYREQFGKPIGAFQGVSGPLAERYVDIQLARALADGAARAVEAGRPADPVVAAAKSAATEAAVATAETAIQISGAIGFTWEHHFHRYLRRGLWLDRFEGSGRTQRAAIAAAVLDGTSAADPVEAMDDPGAAAARAEARAWIEEHLPTAARGLDLVRSPEEHDRVREKWRWAMARNGDLVAHWPEEHGGRGASPLETAIFREEAIRTHPRVSHGDGGTDLVAPLLIKHGTAEQQERFLPGILDETEIWAQGFSEPDAGSDLAALKTRAVPDGDDWILNGNKTWTTYAPYAQWLFVLARTDPSAARHRGISCFIVDAKAPGVEIRPIPDIVGDVEFGEVFLTDVRVPGHNVLGEVNGGWGVAIMTLANERVIESCEDIGELGFTFDRLVECAREVETDRGIAASDPYVRDRIAMFWSRLAAVRLTQHASLVALEASDVPPPESEIIKLVWSELGQRVARLGIDLYGRVADPAAAGIAHFWRDTYLTSRSFTIYAGTSEILRSVIAERILGLPRSR